jgi:predicted metallopeptidase
MTVRSKKGRVLWEKAPDVEKICSEIVSEAGLDWIVEKNLYFCRSHNSKTRAYARIWGLGRLWQRVLDTDPRYIIEVISERFDKLDYLMKKKVLIHELVHIPKNFSGSLVPHIKARGPRNFHSKVNSIFSKIRSL